jgi:putative endonuclease
VSARGLRATLRRTLLRFPRLFVLAFEPDDAELGALGEELAAAHLVRSGWRVRARRLRTRSGEADLVAERGGTIAIVEVKTGRLPTFPRPVGHSLARGTNLRWRPGLRCDERRLARLRRVAREVAGAARRGRHGAARVDLVEVVLAGPRKRFSVVHHEDLRVPIRVDASTGTSGLEPGPKPLR